MACRSPRPDPSRVSTVREQLREQLEVGVACSKLAAKVQLDRSTLAKFATGERSLSGETIDRLARVLNGDAVTATRRRPSSPRADSSRSSTVRARLLKYLEAGGLRAHVAARAGIASEALSRFATSVRSQIDPSVLDRIARALDELPPPEGEVATRAEDPAELPPALAELQRLAARQSDAGTILGALDRWRWSLEGDRVAAIEAIAEACRRHVVFARTGAELSRAVRAYTEGRRVECR